MRKTMLGAALIAAMIFTACSSDDEGGNATCVDEDGETLVITDLGDGMIEVSGNDGSSFIFEDTTLAQVRALVCQ